MTTETTEATETNLTLPIEPRTENKRHRGFKLSRHTNDMLRSQALARGMTETAVVERAIDEFNRNNPLGPVAENPADELCGLLERASGLARTIRQGH